MKQTIEEAKEEERKRIVEIIKEMKENRCGDGEQILQEIIDRINNQ